MSSFLEGIESSTSSSVVDLIPLDPPASNREVHILSKPPQTQAIAAEVGRVPGVEEVLWGTGTEEGTTMAATESIFPGPIMGDSFASRQMTTVQPTSSLMLEDDQGGMAVFDGRSPTALDASLVRRKALVVTMLSSVFLLKSVFICRAKLRLPPARVPN